MNRTTLIELANRIWLWLRLRAEQVAGLPHAQWLGGGLAAAAVLGLLALLYARSNVTLEEESDKVIFFQIGTGSSNGPYFPVGSSLAAVITRPPDSGRCYPGALCGVPGVLAVVKSSAGSIANVRAVGAGHFDSALVQTPFLYDAFRGARAFRGEKPFKNLRAIADVYREPVHLVANRSAHISGVSDLQGRRISIGEKGSITERVALDILRAYDISTRRVTLIRKNEADSAAMMLSNEIDAFFVIEKPPSKRVSDLADLGTVDVIPIAGEQAATLAEGGIYAPVVIPGGTYRFNLPVETIAVGTTWICNQSANADLIYEITKALFQRGNREILPRYMEMLPVDATPEAGETKEAVQALIADASRPLPIAFHPGAARFYEEVKSGLDIDSQLKAGP